LVNVFVAGTLISYPQHKGRQNEVAFVNVEPTTFANPKQAMPRFSAASNALSTSLVSPDWLTKIPTSSYPTAGAYCAMNCGASTGMAVSPASCAMYTEPTAAA